MTDAPPPSIPPSIPPRKRATPSGATGTVTAVPGRGGDGARGNGAPNGPVPPPRAEEARPAALRTFPEPEPDDAELDEASPLAVAVDRTGQWLRKATTGIGTGAAAAYASLTRPRTKDDPMTANTDTATRTAPSATGAPYGGSPAVATPAGGTAPRPQSGRVPTVGGAGPRRVRLAISRVDPWSVMKLSFLLAFAAGLMLVVAVSVLWVTLNEMNLFTNIDSLVRQIVGQESPIDILQYVDFSRVLSVATLVAIVDVFLLTALGTIGAFLYNVVAALVGGVHVTMTDE